MRPVKKMCKISTLRSNISIQTHKFLEYAFKVGKTFFLCGGNTILGKSAIAKVTVARDFWGPLESLMDRSGQKKQPATGLKIL